MWDRLSYFRGCYDSSRRTNEFAIDGFDARQRKTFGILCDFCFDRTITLEDAMVDLF